MGCNKDSRDFERLDIPSTMDECFEALDQLLDEETKEDIKTKNTDELIDYHFGLGLWIRNNWIYPTDGRITKALTDLGFDHPDDMSSEIILRYHHYLNDISY